MGEQREQRYLRVSWQFLSNEEFAWALWDGAVVVALMLFGGDAYWLASEPREMQPFPPDLVDLEARKRYVETCYRISQ